MNQTRHLDALFSKILDDITLYYTAVKSLEVKLKVNEHLPSEGIEVRRILIRLNGLFEEFSKEAAIHTIGAMYQNGHLSPNVSIKEIAKLLLTFKHMDTSK